MRRVHDALRAAEQLLYREARLLDERRFADWLALWTDDATYWIPTRTARAASAADPFVPVESELAPAAGVAFMQETKGHLSLRVARLGTARAWGENPPSRTRRFVTNVELEPGDAQGEWRAYSNLLLHRSRRAGDEHWLTAQRRDRLRSEGGALRLAERKIVVDCAVLPSPNLSVFL
jgi:3-phenylpropionate/cinnamic acid dioxygenase small subunit